MRRPGLSGVRPLGARLAALALAVALPGLLTAGCIAAPAPPDDAPLSPLVVGQSREVELRFLRFDVSNFAQTLTKKDIAALPDAVKQRLWLLDLDLSNSPSSPRLLDNALAQIKALDPATLSPAARNLQKLLNMTPATADLTGTSLAQLISLAPLLGIAPEKVLADMLGVNVEDTFLPSQIIADAILKQVIGTHPNAQTRLGPVTSSNPSGVYPVTPGSLPITLIDAVSDFTTLSARFGPYNQGGASHPGFIVGETHARVLTDAFKLTVHANANALPYKGVDLTSASRASVNSVASQIEHLFDFSDPNWLSIEGLVDGTPSIDSLTFHIVEDPQFIPGGRSPLPTGEGSSPSWHLPPFELERVLVGASQAAFSKVNTTLAYNQPGHAEPLFGATVTNGWQEIFVKGNIGSPPPPSYLWDILLEVAQVRLHDGGIPEGMADVEITLHNIPIGTDTAAITKSIRDNLQADPYSLLDVASRILDNSDGDADFYYYRPSEGDPPTQQGDWLFFVTDGDIPRDKSGKPLRAYGYAHPGFYADEALSAKSSSQELLDGDSMHEKIRLTDGAKLFVEGKAGAVFRLDVRSKPSLNRAQLLVTRVR